MSLGRGVAEVLWGRDVTVEDQARWRNQGFEWCEDPAFGLRQAHGGPCGVLAVVNAEVLCGLLFPDGESVGLGGGQGAALLAAPLADERRDALLVDALTRILLRAKEEGAPVRVVHPTQGPGDDDDAEILEADTAEEARGLVELMLDAWKSPMGVYYFTLSLLHTRSVDGIRADMDAPDCSLTVHFGHCAQELLNLLISGRATSNVFDGVKTMGETSLRGVRERTRVGYLTQLEALRYCEVGNNLKTPQLPVWVIGSQSHFTVLFAVDRRLGVLSAEEELLSRSQRVFREHDVGEAGMVAGDRLGAMLSALGPVLGEEELKLLSAHLDNGLEGYILWDDFWKSVSRLATGESLEQVLASPEPAWKAAMEARQGAARRPRSDSEIARALQASLNAGGDGSEVLQEAAAAAAVAAVAAEVGPEGGGSAAGAGGLEGDAEEVHDLFHFNGLSGGALVPFRVALQRVQHMVGVSVTMASSVMNASSGMSNPLEAVLHTRWPHATVLWGGAEPPSID